MRDNDKFTPSQMIAFWTITGLVLFGFWAALGYALARILGGGQ